MARKLSVCVDLDGVLAAYDGWKGIDHIGLPLPGAREFCRRLASKYNVVIHTARCSPSVGGVHRGDAASLVDRVRTWLDNHGFVYHDIHALEGKPAASCYIDDRAVHCDPQRNPNAYETALAAADALVASQPPP